VGPAVSEVHHTAHTHTAPVYEIRGPVEYRGYRDTEIRGDDGGIPRLVAGVQLRGGTTRDTAGV